MTRKSFRIITNQNAPLPFLELTKPSTVVKLTHEQLGFAQGDWTEEDRERDRIRAKAYRAKEEAAELATNRRYVNLVQSLNGGPLSTLAQEHEPGGNGSDRWCSVCEYDGDYGQTWPCGVILRLEEHIANRDDT